MREIRAREVLGFHMGDRPTAEVVQLMQGDRTKSGPTRTRREAIRAHGTARLSMWGYLVLRALQDKPLWQGGSHKYRNTTKHNHAAR